MVNTETLEKRSLHLSDIPELMALVEEAGWNQTQGDWQRMLTFGTGLGLTDNAGHVVASAVTMPYDGTIGWIGMVLVAGPWRRRGIATDLINACVADLHAGGLVAGLDATPAGEKVYKKMGFFSEITLTRWRRKARNSHRPPRPAPNISSEDIGWITDLDARAFGARRQALIAALAGADTNFARAFRGKAFLLQRPGRYAQQLGPLCSIDKSLAVDLLSQAIDEIGDPLLIDVPDHQRGISDLLSASGFSRERPFKRMYHGGQDYMGDAALIYAIAGPELG